MMHLKKLNNEQGFIGFLVILMLFISLAFFSAQNIKYLKNKFLIKKEAQKFFNDLIFLNLNREKSTCLKMKNNSLNIFDKESNTTLKTRIIDKNLKITLSPKKICCHKALSCSPSSIVISVKNATCKITLSIRGQIKKTCNTELL